MKKISLFIGFTPFHTLICQHIIDNTDGEIVCIFTKGWPKTKKKYKKIGYFSNNLIAKSITYIYTYIKFSIFLKKILKNTIVNVYIPHLTNPFTNFLIHKKVNEINIYEDGILNYYYINSKKFSVSLSKKLLMYICGLRYHNYNGHLTGIENLPINNYYLTRPKHASLKELAKNTVLVEFKTETISVTKSRILFLDHNTDMFLTKDQRKMLINHMFSIYPMEKYNYHYKPHHDYKENFFEKTLSDKLERMAAENVARIIAPEIVISFYSSALINIKTLYPQISCYWLAADMIQILRNNKFETLSNIFKEANVNKIQEK